MREILFKGKRLDNGEWVEGFYVCIGKKYHFIFTGKLDITKGYPEFVHNEVDPETVGQYTGLTDKNGKKMFEGDIVVSTNERRLSNKPEIVKYCPLSGYWMCDPKREPVVIGTIYDNPELLQME